MDNSLVLINDRWEATIIIVFATLHYVQWISPFIRRLERGSLDIMYRYIVEHVEHRICTVVEVVF